MIRHHRKLSKAFIQELNDANRGSDDPHLNAFRLMDDGKPVVSSKLTEYPSNENPTREYQKKDLDDVLADYSDMKGGVDLDTDPSNLSFLQQSIKNIVKRDTQLGESNINVSSGAAPKLPPAKQYFEPTITALR